MPKKEKGIKAIVDGYNPSPFFFKVHDDEDTRIVAWTANISQLKKLFYSTLKLFPEDVDVMLLLYKKTEEIADWNDERQQWNRYYGKAKRDSLTRCVRQFEKYIFCDGFNQLWVRRLDTKEYVVLDDNGIFLIYSDFHKYVDLCKRNNFEERVEKCISEVNHYHVAAHYWFKDKSLENAGEEFISRLNLKFSL